jgi:hypothetical protein
LHPPYCAVDVEHLQHHLQAAATQRGAGFQRRSRQRSPRRGEGVERQLDEILLRERQRPEVAPDRLVLTPRQQQHVGPLDGATGPPDLLVVGDR